MTRINSAINPKNLTDQHLIAELRELPRIFTAVNKRIEKGITFFDIPKEFCLGIGHTIFFYDKLDFLYFRFHSLKNEYKNRYQKDWNDYI
jgi:deoxyribonuclease (pyrimidine dimer)